MVNVLKTKSLASLGFLVGGMRIESFAAVYGNMTFPAFARMGKPSIPVTTNVGFQPLKIRDYKG